jgi:hypothetical protein
VPTAWNLKILGLISNRKFLKFLSRCDGNERLNFYTVGMEVFLIIVTVFIYEIHHQKDRWISLLLVMMGWISLRVFIGFEYYLIYSVVLTVLILLFLQDMDTMYLSVKWLVPVFIASVVWCSFDPVLLIERILGMLLYGLPAACMHLLKKEWIGSADCTALILSGWVLGWERMIIAFMVSAVVGIIWFIFLMLKKRALFIPYISCLSIGIWISLLRGYTIFNCIRAILGL